MYGGIQKTMSIPIYRVLPYPVIMTELGKIYHMYKNVQVVVMVVVVVVMAVCKVQ